MLSFDFSNNHIYNDVFNLVLEKVLVEESENHCKLFVLIGEFYLNDIESKTKKSRNLPEAVVSIYEGDHIEVKWIGIDNPACDVEFLPEVDYLNRSEKDCRNILPSSALIEIGYAHNTDIELLMDDDGIVYFYLHIIDKLYYGGKFLKALMILFFGLEYGELLCPLRNR